MTDPSANASALRARQRRVRAGLSARLLLLTIAFVMIAEVLIYVPSIANFRLNWLNDRLTAAQLASLAAEASPNGDVPQMLRNELLRTAQVKAVAAAFIRMRVLVLEVDPLSRKPLAELPDFPVNHRFGRQIARAALVASDLERQLLGARFHGRSMPFWPSGVCAPANTRGRRPDRVPGPSVQKRTDQCLARVHPAPP